MRRSGIFAIALALLARGAPAAHAAWPAAGDTLYGNSHPMSTAMSLAADGAGGALAWWGNYAGGAPPIVRAARVAADGGVFASWDWTNTPAGSNAGADGLGGLFKSWNFRQTPTSYVFAHHVVAGGGLDPAWPGGGVLVTSTFSIVTQPPTVTHDGAGGALVTWGQAFDVYARRVLANGTLAGGWPAGGLKVNDASTQSFGSPPNLVQSDGAGGAWIAWIATDPQLARITGTGGFAAGWAAGGLSFPGDGNGSSPALVALIPSGTDAMYLCWTDQSAGAQRAWVQRVQNDGSVANGWPANGLLVTSGGVPPGAPAFVSDGADGVVVAWASSGTAARGVRLLASGALASGWSGAGSPLLDPGAVITPSVTPALALAAHAGGVIVNWNDARRPGHRLVRARWIQADGTPDPTVSDSGVVVTPEAAQATVQGALSDGAGGAYIGWQDDTGLNWWWVVLSHAPHPVTTDVPRPSLLASFALRDRWPNPARDALNVRFTLGSAATGRLELLDVAGRRLRAVVVAGAGDHAERFERLGGLPPGVYLVRLTQGTAVSTARIAHLN